MYSQLVRVVEFVASVTPHIEHIRTRSVSILIGNLMSSGLHSLSKRTIRSRADKDILDSLRGGLSTVKYPIGMYCTVAFSHLRASHFFIPIRTNSSAPSNTVSSNRPSLLSRVKASSAATAEPISIREPDIQYRSIVRPPCLMSLSVRVIVSVVPYILISATCLCCLLNSSRTSLEIG